MANFKFGKKSVFKGILLSCLLCSSWLWARTQASSEALVLAEYTAKSAFALQGNATFYRDIPYDNSVFTKFDYFQNTFKHKAPVVIYVHPGSFIGGDKSSSKIKSQVNQFLESGINFIAVNYSLLALDEVDSVGVKKSLFDVAKAVQFVKAFHSELGIDPDKVAIYGQSSGANVALWLAVSDDLAEPDSDDLLTRQSTKVAAVGALEAQASIDFVSWLQIFSKQGVDLDLLSNRDFTWYLASFYGLSSTPLTEVVTSLNSADEDVLAYRKSIDILPLLDSSDPPIYVSNHLAPIDLASPDVQSSPQRFLYTLSHHQMHVDAIRRTAAQSGLEVNAYAPALGIDDAQYTDVVDFLTAVLLSN